MPRSIRAGKKGPDPSNRCSFLRRHAFTFVVLFVLMKLENGVGSVNKYFEKFLSHATGLKSAFTADARSLTTATYAVGIIGTNVTTPTDSNSSEKRKVHNFPEPSVLAGPNAITQLSPPRVGVHRPNKDVVFSFTRGLSAPILARFVGSLLETGYTGDVVLGVLPWSHPEMDQDVKDFLEYHARHSHVIAYEIDIDCQRFGRRTRCQIPRMFVNATTGNYIPDPRIHREMAQLRFEYYWVWSQQYRNNRILALDGRDVYFQRNPFPLFPPASEMLRRLHVYREAPQPPIRHQNSNRLWIRVTRGMEVLNQIGDNTVVCSGSTAGGQIAIESYFRAMVQSFDETQCVILGCDQGHHNYLLYSGWLHNSTNIDHIEFCDQGASVVNTLGLVSAMHKPLRAAGIVDNTTNEVLNYDGSVSAVVHQFDRDSELLAILDRRAEDLFQKWKSDAVQQVKSKT